MNYINRSLSRPRRRATINSTSKHAGIGFRAIAVNLNWFTILPCRPACCTSEGRKPADTIRDDIQPRGEGNAKDRPSLSRQRRVILYPSNPGMKRMLGAALDEPPLSGYQERLHRSYSTAGVHKLSGLKVSATAIRRAGALRLKVMIDFSAAKNVCRLNLRMDRPVYRYLMNDR